MTRAEWLAAYEREAAEFAQQHGLLADRAAWPEDAEAEWRQRWHNFAKANGGIPTWHPDEVRQLLGR